MIYENNNKNTLNNDEELGIKNMDYITNNNESLLKYNSNINLKIKID